MSTTSSPSSSIPNAQQSPPTRFCRACTADLPLEAFGTLNSKTKARKTRCRRCDAKAMTIYRLSKSGERFDGVLAAVLKQGTPTALGAFVTVAMRRFGGIDKFAKLWVESLHAAPKGSRRALDLMLGFVRILEAKEAISQPAASYSQLSDEELNRLTTASLEADAERVQAVADG